MFKNNASEFILGLKGTMIHSDIDRLNELAEKYGKGKDKIHLEMFEQSHMLDDEHYSEQEEELQHFIKTQKESGREVTISAHIAEDYLDLASPNDGFRHKAVEFAKKTIDLVAGALENKNDSGEKSNETAKEGYIVVHAFGMVLPGDTYGNLGPGEFISNEDAYPLLEESIKELTNYVEKSGTNLKILFENSYGENIGSEPEIIKQVINQFNHSGHLDFCLDLSHQQLRYNKSNRDEHYSIDSYFALEPTYFHCVDTIGTDEKTGEGLLVGSGEINWTYVKDLMTSVPGDKVLVSEKKGQEKNNYAGLDDNLERINTLLVNSPSTDYTEAKIAEYGIEA